MREGQGGRMGERKGGRERKGGTVKTKMKKKQKGRG